MVHAGANCLSSSLNHSTVVYSLSIRNGCHPTRNGDAFSADTHTESSAERFWKHCTIKAWVWLEVKSLNRHRGMYECLSRVTAFFAACRESGTQRLDPYRPEYSRLTTSMSGVPLTWKWVAWVRVA